MAGCHLCSGTGECFEVGGDIYLVCWLLSFSIAQLNKVHSLVGSLVHWLVQMDCFARLRANFRMTFWCGMSFWAQRRISWKMLKNEILHPPTGGFRMTVFAAIAREGRPKRSLLFAKGLLRPPQADSQWQDMKRGKWLNKEFAGEMRSRVSRVKRDPPDDRLLADSGTSPLYPPSKGEFWGGAKRGGCRVQSKICELTKWSEIELGKFQNNQIM